MFNRLFMNHGERCDILIIHQHTCKLTFRWWNLHESKWMFSLSETIKTFEKLFSPRCGLHPEGRGMSSTSWRQESLKWICLINTEARHDPQCQLVSGRTLWIILGLIFGRRDTRQKKIQTIHNMESPPTLDIIHHTELSLRRMATKLPNPPANSN